MHEKIILKLYSFTIKIDKYCFDTNYNYKLIK